MFVRRVLVLAVVVPLFLAGCAGEDPEPKMPDPTSSAPAPVPTESETPEVESAEDFIRRWAVVETEMEKSGDTKIYRKLSRGCKACTGLAETIEKFYGAGGFVQWDGWKIRSIDRQQDPEKNAYVVRVASTPTRYRESARGPLKKLDGGLSTHLLRLNRSGESWLVVDKAELPE